MRLPALVNILPLNFVSAEQTQRQTEELFSRRPELQELMKEWEELSAELA